MATSEERLKVLKMVQEGKITPEMAAELLKALDASARKPAPEDSAAGSYPGRGGGRFFRVRVTDTDSGRTRVNVRLPLGMVNAGIRMGMRFSPEVEGLDAAKLAEALATGETGQIMDIYDDEDGEHVEVFIE
ncbi:MAG: hypothetical protein FD147_282 [Chloroflexi bacterium]|nr:MAG: hypothetical protein FD147_282 [Chloroflexota bacterium]